MARKWFAEAVPPHTAAAETDHPLALAAAATVNSVVESMAGLGFKSASEAILQLAISANGHLNDTAPWSRMKQPGQEVEVGDDLYAVLEATRIVGLLLAPLLPDLSNRILAQLGHALNEDAWLAELGWGGLASGAHLPQPTPVMQRLELEGEL